MPQYHYTDRLTKDDILRDGRIKASPMRLHRDFLMRDEGLVTPPLVWLTINPILEGTVVTKLMLANPTSKLFNDLWRFELPDEYAPLGLAEFGDANNIDVEWFAWIIRTGEIACSNYTTWRCLQRDIPASDFRGIQVYSGSTDDGPIWTETLPR